MVYWWKLCKLLSTIECRFHYDYFIKKYPAAKLLFTDTDSLYYEVETPNIEKEMFEKKELFDYWESPADSPYFDATNKKVMGKFKWDERRGYSWVCRNSAENVHLQE